MLSNNLKKNTFKTFLKRYILFNSILEKKQEVNLWLRI